MSEGKAAHKLAREEGEDRESAAIGENTEGNEVFATQYIATLAVVSAKMLFVCGGRGGGNRLR